MAAKDEQIRRTVAREEKRLFRFIRSRVPQEEDAEDILQDVFFQMVNTLSTEPIEQVASWLFRVATNRITDWYRKKKAHTFTSQEVEGEEDDEPRLTELHLLDESNDPDVLYLRSLVWEELEAALDELPAEQREVFVLHELEDRSFKEISKLTGVPVNTLLSRKRYAVLFLRKRLRELYDDLVNG
jgi:RNA polymerase sigma factor (sigma-70 family)